MLQLPGYRVTSQLYESSNSLIFRGLWQENNQPVILKVLKQEYPAPAELTRFQQEYEITSGLDLTGVIKAYRLHHYQNTRVICLEDFGGESLKFWMNDRPLSLPDFFEIAISIADSLGELHRRQIMHKDINPANIVWNPQTRQLKIIDFGISTVLSRETPSLTNPSGLEGTLAYMSPEQTGRMNRAIDYRTDLYSLGATFYELLTGQLPFETQDVLDLVHCHIARQPTPPHELNPTIPPVVSEIVLKLLAKTAEERYQSACGLKADLQRCLDQFNQHQTIASFPLGQRDVSDQFQVSQKLYGRDAEIATLLAAFERVAQGKSELMLVAGYSGIGKSVLVQEIYKSITRQKGYFISGKFDQFQRNIPYSSIIQAFQELIQQLLTETEVQVATWQTKLRSALGNNGQIMIEVIPEIALIIGQQPPVPELGAAEAQNRFNQVLQNFIRVFAQPEHPLVVFLDDLQWADSASLKLIELLMSGAENQSLFLIGAYRDNEVSASHPLMITLNQIQKPEATIESISLSPLRLADVNQLIAETLRRDRSETLPLAELVWQKTNGNPFFINQFLKSLVDDMLLAFDFDRREWQWQLEQIRLQQITDNVVELMAGKILKLPIQTQAVLKLAACIGNQFDLKTLAIAHETSLLETSEHLWKAITEGLILPIGDNYKFIKLLAIEAENDAPNLPQTASYKFLHDRVQQAAYSLIEEDKRNSLHLQIGRLLLAHTTVAEQENMLFDLVSHFNQGVDQITSSPEREQVARLNLLAGKKAKAASAYEPAFTYLKTGLQLLSQDCWETQYDLAIALHTETAEAAYLSGKFEEMQRLIAITLNQGKTLLDQVKAYEIKIQACTSQTQLLPAIETALTVLQLLGVNFPKNPNKVHALISLLQTKWVLTGKRVADLEHLPAMSDPYKLAIMRILSGVASAVYHSTPDLFPLIVLKQIRLSVQYGNAPESPFSYTTYGLILCGVIGDIEAGYQFGQLAYRLLEKLDAKELQAKIRSIVSTFIQPWKEHIRVGLQPCLEAYQAGLETGDLEYAAYGILMRSNYSLYCGRDLREVEPEMAAYNVAIAQMKQEPALFPHQIYWQTALNFMGRVADPCVLTGEAHDEGVMLPIYQSRNSRNAVCQMFVNKSILCYWFQEFRMAFESALVAEANLDCLIGTQSFTTFHLFDSLIRLALFPDSSPLERKSILQRVAANQKKMKRWAHYAPMNHLHRVQLVEAEQHRVLGHDAAAMDAYDRAIALAKEHEYVNEEALAQELAGRFYLAKGKTTIAQAYLLDARYAYLRWGAMAKVDDLDRRYPQLLTATRRSVASGGTIHGSTTTTTSSGSTTSLDLATITKAAKAILGEIVLDKLLAELMQLLIANAGAEKGYLLLMRTDGLYVEAEGTASSDEIQVLQSIPLASDRSLPHAIITYVERTQTEVVLGNALTEGRFTTDPYVTRHQTRSILCAPIMQPGKLLGIIYLENNLTTDAFTPERLEVLSVLSSQAAIALENALLYQTLEQKVEERTVQLTSAEAELRALFSAMPDVVLVRNQQGTCLKIAPTNTINLIRPAEEMVGRSVHETLPEEAAEIVFTAIQQSLTAGKTVTTEYVLNLRDQEVWLSASVSPLSPDSIILVARDITQRKEVEFAFEDSLKQIAAANQEITLLNQKLESENIRMKTELDITRQLQQMILPREEELQQISGLKIAGFMQPADEVGGDYYDVLQQNGITKIGIGDVTGHGLESGVLMLMLQTAVRSLLNNQETDPSRFLNAINRTIYDNAKRMNCDKTITFALVDYQQGQVRIIGQHEEILVVRTGGRIERIDTMALGFPLGLMEDISGFVDQILVELAPGEGIVLYTDGITEAENQARELYGLPRLCQVIEQNWQYPVEQIRQAIVQSIQTYIGDHKIYDDITVVVAKRDE